MKYKTVVIDPPWQIDNIGLTPKAYTTMATDRRVFTRRQRFLDGTPYDTMSIDELMDFPINDFADNESFLFLWVTNSKTEGEPIIKVGFELIDKWGFKYHQMITWDKVSAYAFWTPIATRTEHCLVAYRGNFTKLTNKQNYKMENLLSTPRQNRHSQKPYEFYQRLRTWTPEPRIDIFARQAHVGFDGWGDEYVGEGPLEEYLK